MHFTASNALRPLIAISISGLFLAACGRPNSLQRVDTGQRCGVEGFPPAPSDHIVVELKVPFRVRAVEGAIKSQAGDWPDNTFEIVEFRPRSRSGDVVSTRTDANGTFRMPELGAGEYCFKATAAGWQSITGLVIVSTTANPANRIVFEMPLGV